MGGCSVLNCSNSARKGFRMLRIPQNALRRKLWLKEMNRSDWEPGVEVRVCEEHFAPEMWVSSKNNRKRKLKSDAIPTIFPEPPTKVLHMEKTILGKSKKNLTGNYIDIPNINSKSDQGIEVGKVIPENTSCSIQQRDEQLLHKKPLVVLAKLSLNQISILRKQADPSSSPEKKSDLPTTSTVILPVENEISESIASPEERTHDKNSINEHDFMNETSEINDEFPEKFVYDITEDSSSEVEYVGNATKKYHQRNIFLPVNEEMMKKIIHKQHNRIIVMKKKLKSLRKQLSKPEENSRNVHKRVLESLFSEEQVRALISKYVGGGKGKVHKWSEKTIKTALVLKFSCGNSGYEELLKMGFPFPSQRTLREAMESSNFRIKISNDVVETLEENFNDLPNESDDQNSLLEFDETVIKSEGVYDT